MIQSFILSASAASCTWLYTVRIQFIRINEFSLSATDIFSDSPSVLFVFFLNFHPFSFFFLTTSNNFFQASPAPQKKSVVCSLHPYFLTYILCKQTPKYEVTHIFQQPSKSVCSPDLPAELQSWMHGSLLDVSIKCPMSNPDTTTHLSVKTSRKISLQILQIRLPQHFPFYHFFNSPWYATCQDDDNGEGGCEGEMWC